MAQAVARHTKVRKVIYENVVAGISLHLSVEEASILRELCGSVAGCGPTRIVTDSICRVLLDAGIKATYHKYFKDCISTNKS